MLPYINIPFEYLASVTGAPVDELKLLGSFLLSYPLAGVLKRIPDSKPDQKNLFIVGVALFYLVGLFDLWSGLRTLFISAAGTYAIAKYIKGPYMPWIGFMFLMGHMSINHIFRQIANTPATVDITGAQMVTVMKLSGFCWNVYDGRQPDAELVDFQRLRMLRQLPSLLDYAGYVLFFPSLLVGPAFDFADYKMWIETTMFTVPSGTDPAQMPRTRKQRKIPRSGRPALFKAAQGLAWIGLFMALSAHYNSSVVLEESYAQYGFLRRVWLLHMLGFTTRLKYYGVWCLTEGACILSGMGFKGLDPKTGRLSWDRLQNVNPLGIETAQNSRAYLENWNMNTNNWLRNYVYLRVTPKGQKPGFRASLATFATSAFWHGFYAGYYLSFLFASFIQTVAKNFRRYVRPLFLTPDGTKPLSSKRYYDFACYVATQTIFSFTVAPFVLLDLGDSLLVWRRVYFYAIIAVGASILLFSSPAKAWLIRRQKSRVQHFTNDSATTTTSSPAGKASAARKTEKGSNASEPQRRISSNTSAPLQRMDSFDQPLLGMPSDPEREVQEAVREIQAEVEGRRRRGSTAQMPTGEELRVAVRERLEAWTRTRVDGGSAKMN